MTALSLARRLRASLALSCDPTYRAALFVAHQHGLVDPNGLRSVYTLGPVATAETALCACAAGGRLTKLHGEFLAAVRASGLVACLSELVVDPAALADSVFVIDAAGQAIRLHAVGEADGSTSIAVEHFGTPAGRTYCLRGADMAAALGG